MQTMWNPFNPLLRLVAILLAVVGIRRGGNTARLVLAAIADWLSANLVQEIAHLIRIWRPGPARSPWPGDRTIGRARDERFEKFTERARKVLSLANDEAARFNHNYIGTEHILLGLVREGDGVAAKVLMNMGVQLPKVRAAVEFIIGRGDRPPQGDIGLTPRAKRVIELAFDEAKRQNHHYIGTEHLLLGLVREGEGIAAGVLESLGVSLEKVRAQVIRVLNTQGRWSG